MSRFVTVLPLTTAGEELRVSLDDSSGLHRVDIRIFAPFTPARVLMPTRRSVLIDIELLPSLIEALGLVRSEAERRG